MKEYEAWWAQIESDYAAAQLMLQSGEIRIYCQIVAKFQQISEKSVNAVDAALRDVGIIHDRARAEHYPERMLNRLTRLPRAASQDLATKIGVAFADRWRAEIHDLCGLAPRLPEVGMPYQRNTEYPYNTAIGDWTAPGVAGSFSSQEIERYRTLADHLYRNVPRIISAIRRA